MQIRIFFQMSTCVAAGTEKLNANSVCEKIFNFSASSTGYFVTIANTSASLPDLLFLNLISFFVSVGANSDF